MVAVVAAFPFMQRPQILNEALVQRPSDMLLFSKKARPVEYKPCTLKEYRETKPTAYMELGKLQPDLHTEELLAKVIASVSTTILEQHHSAHAYLPGRYSSIHVDLFEGRTMTKHRADYHNT